MIITFALVCKLEMQKLGRRKKRLTWGCCLKMKMIVMESLRLLVKHTFSLLLFFLFLFSLVVCLLFILCTSNSPFVGQNWVITFVILECIIIKIYQTCTFEVKLMQIVFLFLCLLDFTLQGFNETI